MFLLSLFSGSMFVLPVALTGGLYVGLRHQQVIDTVQGKPPPNINPDGTPRLIETTQYCQKAYGIDPYPYRYTYNPNQWGDPGNTGALCLNITTDSGVAVDDLNSFNWTATWGYPQGPESEPVHAFPNAKLNDTAFPIQVQNIQSLTLDVQWNYAPGNVATDSTDLDALTAAQLNANVAVDMFLSDDQTKAENSTLATHEIMVWLGQFGPSTKPLGYSATPSLQQQAGGVTFSLYYNTNGQGQEVFTWIAAQNTTSFSGDISPLITALSSIPNAPTGQTYLGYYAFGSETFYSVGNVTLSVPKLALEVNGK